MDTFEIRRRKLTTLLREECDGVASDLAKKIGREPSYVSRMLYPANKEGGKNIGEEMARLIEKSFGLPMGWMDDLDNNTRPYDNLDPDIKKLISAYRKLPSFAQTYFLALMTDYGRGSASSVKSHNERRRQDRRSSTK